MQASENQMFDVVIAGGSVAGASLAIRLAQANLKVLIIEAKKFPRAKLCGEFISPECAAHFRELGVEDLIEQAGGATIDETIFYAASGARARVPSRWLSKHETSAWGLSRAAMDARLLRQARAAGAQVVEDARVSQVLITQNAVRGVQIKNKNGDAVSVSSRLVIDATGRARSLARRVRLETTNFSKIQKGALTNCNFIQSYLRYYQHRSHEQPARKRAELVAYKVHVKLNNQSETAAAKHCAMFFYTGGYGGVNRVEGGLYNLCFIVTARQARAAGSEARTILEQVVFENRAAREMLKDACFVDEPLAVAIESFGQFEIAPGQNLICIGDAAAFIDPFTGSGMLLALESARLAAQVIARHVDDLRTAPDVAWQALKEDYARQYGQMFDKRLQACGWLRRVAFAPAWTIEAATRLLAASDFLRHTLARKTRGHNLPPPSKARRANVQ